MPSKVDNRHKQIGGRHRAASRFAMIRNRLANPVGKNACYAGVKLLISKEDFIAWFMANDFPGASVDRIKVEKHYEAGNLQLIPTGINSGKDKTKAVDGKCECYRCHKLKPLNEFVKESRRRINGRSTICIECERLRYQDRKARGTQ